MLDDRCPIQALYTWLLHARLVILLILIANAFVTCTTIGEVATLGHVGIWSRLEVRLRNVHDTALITLWTCITCIPQKIAVSQVGVWQESNAEKALDALKRLGGFLH